uniref:Uncharacterized protein n=1 Tax=Gouania willdenowi TaxID=441366 RepID=A0A8C5GMQ8_GOUWI
VEMSVPEAGEVSSFFTHTVICYFLDVFLLLYCVFFTVIFFREKYKKDVEAAKSVSLHHSISFSFVCDLKKSVLFSSLQDDSGVYQVRPRPSLFYRLMESILAQMFFSVQELRSTDADPYQALEPSKRKVAIY